MSERPQETQSKPRPRQNLLKDAYNYLQSNPDTVFTISAIANEINGRPDSLSASLSYFHRLHPEGNLVRVARGMYMYRSPNRPESDGQIKPMTLQQVIGNLPVAPKQLDTDAVRTHVSVTGRPEPYGPTPYDQELDARVREPKPTPETEVSPEEVAEYEAMQDEMEQGDKVFMREVRRIMTLPDNLYESIGKTRNGQIVVRDTEGNLYRLEDL